MGAAGGGRCLAGPRAALTSDERPDFALLCRDVKRLRMKREFLKTVATSRHAPA